VPKVICGTRKAKGLLGDTRDKVDAMLCGAVTNVALMFLKHNREMSKAALKAAFKEPCGQAALKMNNSRRM
jgi:hypothetical protein